MYLKEIGRVPLLSMEDERRLAMSIESGEKEALKNGTADNRIMLDGEDSKRKLTEANLRWSCRSRKSTSAAACCFST